MTISKVVVAGGGVMGSQVAWQLATHGIEVAVCGSTLAGLDRCKRFIDGHARHFLDARGASQHDIEAARARLSYGNDLAAALIDADLIIEQVPENIELKRDFWRQASALAPDKTIFATNTSTFLPSAIVDVIEHPEKFLAMHYMVPVWDTVLVEIMSQHKTDPKYRAALVEFAPQVGLVPIEIKKEQPGYVVNSLLVPFIIAGLDLVRRGVADFQTVDLVWRAANKSELGPCQVMDMVGMNVVHNGFVNYAAATNDPELAASAEFIKSEFLDKGHLGIESGQGFYSYPAS